MNSLTNSQKPHKPHKSHKPHKPQSPPKPAPSDQTPEVYTVRDAARLLNLRSKHIRAYCNRGLIPHVKRTITGYRIFTEAQLNQIANIAALYRCECSTAEIKTYLRSSPAKQKRLLGTKKRQLWQKLESIRQNIDYIERQEYLLNK